MSMSKPIRVLVAKAGLDGHDRGAKVVAAALRDAGMEVIYTGLRKTPEAIVEAALQEDVDAIGISILSGAHMTLFPRILTLMRDRKIGDVLLFGGGIIPERDIETLKKMGVGELFTPGASTQSIVDYVRSRVEARAAE
jgi:methylmalonyl-CoA mutase C-terminal domain/subunit